ncbi:MAG: alpha/beta fold hydrolase [Bacteroidota bacterium]
MMKSKYFLLIFFIGFSTSVLSQLKQIKANAAIFNYTDKGSGEPIVFIHGGLEDYRTWDAQIDTFSKHYRIVTYSRRFNFPNHNTKKVKEFSAKTEAEDLASLITQLQLGPVHLVGHSFGGLISLFLVKQHPELVRTLTLSEPALISWLPDIAGGEILYDNFYNQLWKPVKQASKAKDTLAVLKHTLIYFAGEDILDKLPQEIKTQFILNIPEWFSIAYSPEAFPDFKKEYLKDIKVPVLLLSGGQTLPMLQLLNKELKSALPNAQQYHLDEGTHDYWVTHPQQMGQVLLRFLQTTSPK